MMEFDHDREPPRLAIAACQDMIFILLVVKYCLHVKQAAENAPASASKSTSLPFDHISHLNSTMIAISGWKTFLLKVLILQPATVQRVQARVQARVLLLVLVLIQIVTRLGLIFEFFLKCDGNIKLQVVLVLVLISFMILVVSLSYHPYTCTAPVKKTRYYTTQSKN
jgi:hypothetical protein